MDSYEKLKKMTEISKQLKKHGLVSDSNEAIKQAEQMVVSGSKNEYEVYVTQDKFETATKNMAEKEDTDNMEKYAEIISALKQMQITMDEKVDVQNSDINMIKGKMNEIIAKINEFESKLSNQQRHEVQAKLSESKPEQRRETSSSSESKDDKRIRPEVKNEYTENDVSIDKVFYVGKR